MGEDDLIARLFAPLARTEGAAGLKDDVAAWLPSAGETTILTVDAVVEGTHFLPGDPMRMVAKKLVRRNLSDVLAKGGQARACLLSLVWPYGRSLSDLADFTEGLGGDLDAFGIDLLGGDTTRSDGPVVASLTLIGTCGLAGPVRRSGAKPGDTVFLTGTIGESGLGLRAARGENLGLDQADVERLVSRYRVPVLPDREIAKLIAAHASAAIDVSDGVLLDADRLGAASGCALALDLSRMPVSLAVERWLAQQPDGMQARAALAGMGDDYQILFTAAPNAEQDIHQAAAALGQLVTVIGQAVSTDLVGSTHQTRARGHDPFTKL